MRHGILVALDGSPFAARALPYAELLAQRTHAELILARAVDVPAPTLPSPPSSADAQTTQHAFAEAEAYLAALQREVAAEVASVTAVAEGGPPARVLLELARAREVALIVMATHGRSGPSRWVVGSVAEQVLRATHLPILLLTPAALDAGSPQRLLQRLMVAVDGSELSQRIFPVAKELARRLPAPLTLVQALEPILTYGPALPYTAVPPPTEVFESAKAAIVASLRNIADLWRGEGLEVDIATEMGRPADVITDAAAKRQAGWIALASHGRGGLGGLVLGSTALAVLHQSTLPVLIAAMPSLDRYQLGTAE